MTRKKCIPENMRLSLARLPKSERDRLDLLCDPEIVRVLAYIESNSDFFHFMGSALRDSFDAVIDFPNTGRRGVSDPDVQKNEKTFVGTKMELKLAALLWTEERGDEMDLSLDGVDTDVKFSSSKFNAWMIPREAYRKQPNGADGHLCLCVFADDAGLQPKYDAVLIRASEDRLSRGENQDGKKTFTAEGMLEHGILLQAGQHYPASILAHLTREQVRELFRIDGLERLVRCADMLIENEARVTLQPSDILLLGRSTHADIFLNEAADLFEKAGIGIRRSERGSVKFFRK